jgi:hypothetical protein
MGVVLIALVILVVATIMVSYYWYGFTTYHGDLANSNLLVAETTNNLQNMNAEMNKALVSMHDLHGSPIVFTNSYDNYDTIKAQIVKAINQNEEFMKTNQIGTMQYQQYMSNQMKVLEQIGNAIVDTNQYYTVNPLKSPVIPMVVLMIIIPLGLLVSDVDYRIEEYNDRKRAANRLHQR